MRDNNTFNLPPGKTVWLGGPSAAINLGGKGPGPVIINLDDKSPKPAIINRDDKSPRPAKGAKARVWKVEDGSL